ncbi:hypothetical protein HYR99_21740 [Candidatus Poribacteria bacterium]|nr:hypothetical protein [Candidatus Poribacteria bacterium]
MNTNNTIRQLKRIAALIVCGVLIATGASFGQSTKEIYVATWNVENLFDDVDAPQSHDDEQMTWWNTPLYQKKLQRLSEIMGQMNNGKGPDILALIEVENAKVLSDLVQKLPHPKEYAIVHIEGKASRGLEVGLITRFPVLEKRSHFVWDGLRDILQVDLNVYGKRLTVLVVHWKSRVGGTFETADLRTLCAARTYQLYQDIVRHNETADILITGDFNDTPQNLSITDVLHAKASREKVLRQRGHNYLYNCMTELLGKSPGTHFYDHEWSFLDQIIVSKGLLDHDGLAYQPGSIAVLNPNGVLIREGAPWRFGGKNEKHRGYSDHLPLIARFLVYP